MTKSDLVDAVGKLQGIPKQEAVDLVETVIDLIKGTLASGEMVKISGFGRLEVKPKHARKGRNPQTGQEIIIDPRNVVIFRPSNVLKSGINAAE